MRTVAEPKFTSVDEMFKVFSYIADIKQLLSLVENLLLACALQLEEIARRE